MFGLSLTEIVVVAVVALLVLGPDRIPSVARSIGRMLAELRRAVDEVKYEFRLQDVMRPLPPTPRVGGLMAEVPKLESIIEEPTPMNCEEEAKTKAVKPQEVDEA
jgi:TatA/E family protein of Tat protein translocase